MARRYFTDEEVSHAKDLRAQGMGFSAIGRILGRSGNVIECRLKKEAGGFNLLGRKCADCGTDIPDANKTGYCRKHSTTHLNYDPEFKAKRLAGLGASEKLKAGAPARLAAAKKASLKRMANPKYVAWLREFMRTVVAPASHGPGVVRDMKAAAVKRTETLLGWCPPEYRDAYRYLVHNKNIRAAEAKPIILAQVKADIARLSPFERQMRALNNGGQLIANDQKPSLANPGIYEERRAG